MIIDMRMKNAYNNKKNYFSEYENVEHWLGIKN